MSTGQQKSSKRPWTGDEDAALLELVKDHGSCGSWPTIALHMQYRSGKQCRERYINQLDPNIKKSMWTYEEDAIIIRLHNQYGKKWSMFMDHLPGRSDNAIKNRYHVISRDNYSDHRHQKQFFEEEAQALQESESSSSSGGDDQSDDPQPDHTDALLESLLSKRRVLDRQIDELVQKKGTRPRAVTVDEVGHSIGASSLRSVKPRRDLPSPDSQHTHVSEDENEPVPSVNASAQLHSPYFPKFLSVAATNGSVNRPKTHHQQNDVAVDSLLLLKVALHPPSTCDSASTGVSRDSGTLKSVAVMNESGTGSTEHIQHIQTIDAQESPSTTMVRFDANTSALEWFRTVLH